MKYQATQSPSNQKGAALLVAMVIIFMLTILGIGAVRDSTLEGKLATNSAHKELTFQSAESAADFVIAIDDPNNADAIEKVICKPEVTKQMNELSVPDVQVTTVTVAYAGTYLPTGWSLGGPVGGRRFVVTGESTLAGVNTSTKITQGVVAIGAATLGDDC